MDVIGFLSVDPALDGSTHEPSDFDNISEIQANNPPPSLVPRLHAILIREVPHINPLMPSSKTALESSLNVSTENTKEIYQDIKLALTQCLFGDTVAAEYLLAHLVSTVYVRSELQTLGQYCLNLSNIPAEAIPEFTTLIYEILEMLLPASHLFPMTLENMNTTQFNPKLDYH